MALKHKYIRLVKSEQEYEDLINNRELEEAAVIAITDTRDTIPDEYQFSTRTTNKDNEVKGKYNALDPIRTFGGLELIWGYFGWTWEDYLFNPNNEEDEEGNPIGEILKGGHFIILKDTTEYPRIYDGYRLQHINDFCSELKKNTNIGYFDNSEIISAERAFTNIVQSGSYVYYYAYGKLDEGNNVWPKLVNVTDMFCSKDTFTRWSLPNTELYLPAVIVCNYLFNEYTLGKCPIVNFEALEVIEAFARSLYKNSSNDTFYFGDYPESVAKGLSNCYDFGLWNTYTGGTYKFKSAYVGDKTFILPRVEAKTSSVMNLFIECNIPWTIRGSFKGYSSTSLKMDLSNLDFTKAVAPEDRFLYMLQNMNVSQDTSDDNYVPGLPKSVQKLWLMYNCYIKGDFVFDAKNDALDYYYFREFYDCRLNAETDSLTINNLHLWKQIDMSISGNYRIDVENQTSTYNRPYNLNIQLCPKVNGDIQKVQFSYLKLPYMIHKDEDIELTGYEHIGYYIEEDEVEKTNRFEFKGKYENCTYHINVDVPVDLNFQLVDGVTPVIASDKPICFKSNSFLGSNWGLNDSNVRRVYFGGLQLQDPNYRMDGMDTASQRDYWYWYFHDAENLEYIDLPIYNNMSYAFHKCSKLDHNCILNHFQQLPGKGRTLYINRLVWNKFTEKEQEFIESKVTSMTIHENEN